MSKRVDVKYDNGDKIFFVSDTHFKHSHILKFCNRPFKDVEEMDRKLIENWNNRVPADGLVFHLGDFGWGGYQEYKKIREQLNGKIILIKGNHDWRNGCQSDAQYNELFELATQQLFIEIEGRKIYLNHVPFLCYGGTYRDEKGLVYQLHGHVHISNFANRNNGMDCNRCFSMLFPTQYDVGVDFNDFTPISFHEVDEKIKKQIETKQNLKIWIHE